MRRIREVLRLKFELGLNDAETARGAGIARSTVQDYLRRTAATGVDPRQLMALDDEALDRRLFPPRDAASSGRPLPQWEAVERDLRGRGVTLRLLWQEYLDTQPGGYQYTQFLRLYRTWQKASRPPVMRQTHRAGVALEVDYAGMTLTVVDMGQPREAQIFVACLPCSQLIYAEASWSQGHEDWLGSHVRALAWIGGCPQTLVPDNLKSGVTDASYYDPVLNRSYHELARHYGIAVLPARVRRPRDKSSVESSVNQVERWVLAPLRNRQLLSLDEANAAIIERVEAFNRRPFSPPREGSRRSLFEAVERAALKPLPREPFAVGKWALCRRRHKAHHLRELQALIEIEKEDWARRMQTLLRRACHVAHLAADRKQVPDQRLIDLIGRRYDAITAGAIAFHETLPALSVKLKRDGTPRAGRRKRRPGHNLALRFVDHKSAVLRCLTNPDVPFTNNQAERDARMMKLKQKISGCFRSLDGANDFMVIRTLIGTAKKRGWGVIQSLMRDPRELIAQLHAG